jgi:hypothetical protein
MTTILEHFNHVRKPFVPGTVQQYLALQLARRLNDLDQLSWYLKIVDHCSRETLAGIFEQSQREHTPREFFFRAVNEIINA